jgi:hypothetical protein
MIQKVRREAIGAEAKAIGTWAGVLLTNTETAEALAAAKEAADLDVNAHRGHDASEGPSAAEAERLMAAAAEAETSVWSPKKGIPSRGFSEEEDKRQRLRVFIASLHSRAAAEKKTNTKVALWGGGKTIKGKPQTSDQLKSFIASLAEGKAGRGMLRAALGPEKGGQTGKEAGEEKEAEEGDLPVLTSGGDSRDQVGGMDDANADLHPNWPTHLPTHSPTAKPTARVDVPTTVPTPTPTEWYQDCPAITVRGLVKGHPQFGRMGEYKLLSRRSGEYTQALGVHRQSEGNRTGTRPVYITRKSGGGDNYFYFHHSAHRPGQQQGQHFAGRWIIGPNLFSPSGGLFVKSNAMSPADVELTDRLDRAWAKSLHKKGKAKWEKKHATQGKWKVFEGGNAKHNWRKVPGGIASHCVKRLPQGGT